MDDERSKGSTEAQHQLDAAKAAEKAKEAEKKAPMPDSTALLGMETAPMARHQLAEELGVDTDVDRDTDSDGSLDTDTKPDVEKNVDELIAEFGLSDTGNAKHNFFQVAEQLAHEVETKYGVPWQVCLAQSCLESGYGQSGLTKKGFNCFGFKTGGSGYSGDKVTMPTREEKNGQSYTIQADFRAYGSIRDSFYDYGRLLNTDRYKPAFEFKNSPALFLAKVIECGYATDSHYVEKASEVGKQFGAKVFEMTSHVLSSTETGKPEEKDWLAKVGDFFSKLGTGISDTFKKTYGSIKKSFVGALAWLGFEVGKEEAPVLVESGEWQKKVEYPDAPVGSFEKGVKGVVTSMFGARLNPFDHSEVDDHAHAGVDISAPLGTKMYATGPGVIVGPHSDSTETVRRDDGAEVTYHHFSQEGPPVGTRVVAGDFLGAVGNVGRSTGSHLHMQVKVEGRLVDPTPYLPPELQTQAKTVAARQKQKVDAVRGEGSRLA